MTQLTSLKAMMALTLLALLQCAYCQSRIYYGKLPSPDDRQETMVTAFDDDGRGQGGVDFDAYPIKMRLPSNSNTKSLGVHGDEVKVYPAAVNSKAYANYMWGIFRLWIEDTNEIIYIHIVDRCDPSDSECGDNSEKYGFLVDIHKSAWEAAGVPSGSLLSFGKVTYVTRLSPDSMVRYYGRRNYMDDYVLCGCNTADCQPEKLGSGPFWCPPGRCHLGSSC